MRSLRIAALAAATFAVACSSKTEEPPAGVFAPVSAATSAASPSVSAVASMPSSSSDPVVVPPTVKGILPAGFGDKLLPAGAPVRVALLTSGAEPRAALQYAFRPGTSRSTLLLIHPEVGVEGQAASEMKLPDLALRITLTVAAHEGDAVRLAGKLTDVQVASEIPAGVDRAPFDAALAAMRKLGFVLAVDPHGRLRGFEITGGDPADPGPTQMLEQMKQGLASLVVPLPNEPVGLGATWQSVSRVKGRTELLQFASYKLVSLSEGVFEVESRAELFAIDDRLQLPGGAARIDQFSSSADGATKASLEEVGARSGRWDIRSSIRVTGGANPVEMSSKIHFEMTP